MLFRRSAFWGAPVNIRTFLLSVSLLGLAALSLSTTACSDSDPVLVSTEGMECQEEGATSGDLVCRDGRWVSREDLDAGAEEVDTGPCEPESDEEFCGRADDECGMVVANDNCGDARGVDCSQLDGFGCEAPQVCVLAADDASLDVNTCQCPAVDAADEICDIVGAECGTIEPGELCADWDEFDPVDCGGCPEEGVECGTDTPNVCGCPCEVDGACANLETDARNCGTCGNACGSNELCEGGACVCNESRTDADVCAAQGAECGTVDDVCGDPVNCPTCGTDQVCDESDNTCVECVSDSDCSSDKVCGDGTCVQCVSDYHCGGTGQVCDGNTCVCNESRTDAEVCSDQGAECGTVDDVCGDPITCPSCSAGESCNGNTCVECSSDNDCASNERCTNGTCECVPDCAFYCDGESDGCGGTCPTCGTGEVCCYGTCETHDGDYCPY